MNITEAEAFFKQYDGHGFHMCRENPPKYEVYKSLNISLETEEQWRQEMIQDYFITFFSDLEHVWIRHSHVIDIISGSQTKVEENCVQLLNLMEQMQYLDKKQKILVIETMAGRTKEQKDGGCYLMCSRTSLGTQMNAVMKKLMDFECTSDDDSGERGWTDIRSRFLTAVTSYERAYNRFKK